MRTSTATTTERPTGAAGLTLLELVATLAVVAVAAGIVLPRLRPAGALGVDAAARRIAARLSEARSRAILGGHPIRLGVAGGLPASVRVDALHVGGAARPADTALVLGPDGDALPASIDLVDASGRRARIVLPPGMGPARVEPGGGA